MNTKMLREQAHREKKAMKSEAKEKAKIAKEIAAKVVDQVEDVDEAVIQKVAEAQESVVHAAHMAKADVQADIKRADQINREIVTGVGKAVNDVKHTGHDVVEKIKHL